MLPAEPGQDLLKGPFHASLVVILELVLVADQCKGVRDSQLRRQGRKTWLEAGTLWPMPGPQHTPWQASQAGPCPGGRTKCVETYLQLTFKHWETAHKTQSSALSCEK